MNRLILVLAIGFLACNSAADRQKKAAGKSILADSVPMIKKQMTQIDCTTVLAELLNQ